MGYVIARYKLKQDRVEENLALIEAVYEELHRSEHEGFSYSTFQLEDDVTFVHVAVAEGSNPLPRSVAFRRFQAVIAERCEEQPVVLSARTVGSFPGRPGPAQLFGA